MGSAESKELAPVGSQGVTVKRSRQVQLDTVVSNLYDTLSMSGYALGFAGGDDWYIYRDGYWRGMKPSDRADMNRLLEKLCAEVDLVFAEKHATVWKRLETAHQFAIDPKNFDQLPLISLNNGTFNIETRSFVPDSPSNMITRFVDIDWVPDAQCPMWESILRDILDDRDDKTRAQIIGLLQEWFGMALVGGASSRTPRALRKALFLYGPAWAGKSTILNTLRNLIGTGQIATSTVSDISDRFGLEKFVGAKAWIAEEAASSVKVSDSGRVKCLITGEPVNVPRKNKLDTDLVFTGPVVWAANTRPTFDENSNALYTRILVLALERTFTPEEAAAKFGKLKPDEWLKENGELPGIFAWALRGYDRLLERGQYESVADLQGAGESWREQNDAIYAFLKECCDYDPEVTNTAANLAWAAFAFSRGTRNEFIKLQKIRADIRASVKAVYPRVQMERPRRDDGRRLVYNGLKLNKVGLAYLTNAKLENESAADEISPANESLIGRGN